MSLPPVPRPPGSRGENPQRQRLLKQIEEALHIYCDANDWVKIRPAEMAEIALQQIEKGGSLDDGAEIKVCTCEHTGYGKHAEHCALT